MNKAKRVPWSDERKAKFKELMAARKGISGQSHYERSLTKLANKVFGGLEEMLIYNNKILREADGHVTIDETKRKIKILENLIGKT